MTLPLLLAGPILRRVEPDLVAVWFALSKPAVGTLRVWEGRQAAGTTNAPFATSDDPADPNRPAPRPGPATVRVGANLHLGMLSVRLPPGGGKSFLPDRLYSYDLAIELADETKFDLAGLGLLAARTESGVPGVPLGYDPGVLPSFALPPTAIDDLVIAYGSCRRPGYDDGDAMAWLDEYLETRVDDPRTRVHQLFLGGDQIYADDVDALMMLRLVELGVELIGSGADGLPIERVKVDTILRKTVANSQPNPLDPGAAYKPETADETAAAGDLPAGGTHFPVDHRFELTGRSAQFTGVDGKNQLISFGEFAAAYLMYWSPACWGVAIPGARLFPTLGQPASVPLSWSDTPTADPPQGIGWPEPGFPERVPQHLFKTKEELAKELEERSKDPPDPAKQAEGARQSHAVHRRFLAGLSRVQRLLANAPTYMILDDHDVTDDFFLNPMWRHRVLATALGQVILTNAMTAYALFQDWGNHPRRYDQAAPGELLTHATRLFPAGIAAGPDSAAFDALARLYGHDLDNSALPDGRFGAVDPPMSWHYHVDGPAHRVVVLDNRTRRSYLAEIGPPGNVSAEALVEQLPRPPLPAGRKVLVVVVPLQVLGTAVLDDNVNPSIYRIFDTVNSFKLADDKLSGSRRMPGTNPDALETWSLDPLTFEHLLERLAEYGRVVVLSGDVHNSASNLMSYWRGDAARPARIAQFTSSGFKNVMPMYLQALDRSVPFLQQLLRAKVGTERLGWDRPADDLVLLPEGRSTLDLVATMRSRLLRSPVLLPTWGWLDDTPNDAAQPTPERTTRLNPQRPPDWRWRVRPLIDERADDQRPSPIRTPPIDDVAVAAELADQATAIDAYQKIAARHQSAIDRMRHTRQMMFRSNFGICRFESGPGETLTAISELHTQSVDPETNLPVTGAYMVHRAELGPVDEDRPERLRTSVIEPIPVPTRPLPGRVPPGGVEGDLEGVDRG